MTTDEILVSRKNERQRQLNTINEAICKKIISLYSGELEFINNCSALLFMNKSLTFKQSKWLRKIYNRVG
jgi:hypothetical protein